jgi:glycosyltransferase involved in cell wall biosynthesis
LANNWLFGEENKMRNKNILFISSQNVFNPSSGVESRISNLVKIYSNTNNLTILAPKQNIKFDQYYGILFKSKFNKIYSSKLIKLANTLHKQKKFDFIFATTLLSGLNGFILSKKLKIPFYFDDHNIEFLRYKRTKSLIWPFVYLFERFLCKFATKVICVSQTDKKFMKKYFKLNLNKITVIENPVDTNIFYPNSEVKSKIRKELNLKEKEKFILFFGQLNYTPNVEALKIIKKEIIPKLEGGEQSYKIVICGKGDGKGLLKEFKHKNLIFKGFVEKIEDYINASDVVIAPLLSGSGTRIKILEALACNKKVISTTIGAEGIHKTKNLIILDNWQKFVENII